jgi:hypothetical protein
MPHLNATGKKMPGRDELELVVNSSEKKKPDQDSPWVLDDWLELEGHGGQPLLVSYQWLRGSRHLFQSHGRAPEAQGRAVPAAATTEQK